jgi:peptide deformylase
LVGRTAVRLTRQVRRLGLDPLATMCMASGAGLAAPPVGVLQRAIVVDVADRHITWSTLRSVPLKRSRRGWRAV